MRNTPVSALLLASALVGLTGCGGGDPVGPDDTACADFLLQYGAAPADTVTAQQGLKYIEISAGTGTAASVAMTVDVNYSGYLINGTRFDTSCPAGAPVLRVNLGGGQVISGFDLGIRGMRPGGVRRVIIPPALGYGGTANGQIPANSTLIFDLQLVRIVE
jgi:peptidylprolyl isomerase